MATIARPARTSPGFARHGDTARIVRDRSDRPPQANGLPETRAQPSRRLLKPAHEPILLRTTLGVHKRLPAPAGADVEEHVQERHVGWLGREYVRRRRREHGARPWASELPVEPAVERHRVQRMCLRCLPRTVERDPVRRLLQRRNCARALGEVLSVVALLAADPPAR
jgi:hypothetical protein